MWIEPTDLSVRFVTHLYHLGRVSAVAHDEWPLSEMRQRSIFRRRPAAMGRVFRYTGEWPALLPLA